MQTRTAMAGDVIAGETQCHGDELASFSSRPWLAGCPNRRQYLLLQPECQAEMARRHSAIGLAGPRSLAPGVFYRLGDAASGPHAAAGGAGHVLCHLVGSNAGSQHSRAHWHSRLSETWQQIGSGPASTEAGCGSRRHDAGQHQQPHPCPLRRCLWGEKVRLWCLRLHGPQKYLPAPCDGRPDASA